MRCCLMRRELASPSPWPRPPPLKSVGPCDAQAHETETRKQLPASCSVLGTMPVPMAVSEKVWWLPGLGRLGAPPELSLPSPPHRA